MHEAEDASRPADAIVSAWVRVRRQITDADRGEIIELFYALLRHQARLGWWLEKQGRLATPRNRLLAWLALGPGLKPDEVRRLFPGGRGGSVQLTSEDLELLSRLKGGSLEHPAMPEAVLAECPDWAVGPLRRRFGDSFVREMEALQAPAPLDLRINPLKTTRNDVLERLSALGVRAEACERAPHGVRLRDRMSLARLPMLRTGEAEIQDEGSQLVAALVSARSGERVVDFCAGAGGKTLAIATQMANRGLVVACDVSEGRLKRATERLRKAGLNNVQTRLLSSERDRWVKRHKAGFDRVLVDAPCSGTGTWRRNPEARWRTDRAGFETLVPLQAAILDSAARLVKPGGRLVYATCSLLREENEDQVEAFLRTHPEFRVVPLREAAPELTGSAHSEHLSLTPARHGTDGFFAAVMQRVTI